MAAAGGHQYQHEDGEEMMDDEEVMVDEHGNIIENLDDEDEEDQ